MGGIPMCHQQYRDMHRTIRMAGKECGAAERYKISFFFNFPNRLPIPTRRQHQTRGHLAQGLLVYGDVVRRRPTATPGRTRTVGHFIQRNQFVIFIINKIFRNTGPSSR